MKKKRNRKLEQIIHTGQDLMFRFGFNRVTVEEICRTAGVSKMTFYKYFANKTELFKQVLNEIWDESVQQYQTIMAQNVSYAEKVRQIIQMKIDLSEQLSQDFLAEYIKYLDQEEQLSLQQRTRDLYASIVQDYIQAQERGDIRADIKPEFIYYFLTHLVDMMKDPQLQKMYATPKELIAELINFFFYGILPR